MMLEELKQEKVVAVLRAKNIEEGMKYVDACISGGINAIELTYSIPDVCVLIEMVKKKYPQALIGIGSVLTKKQAYEAYLAGAVYIVSPGYVDEVQKFCTNNKIVYMPGAMTISEIINSMAQGNEITKLFPGDVFGPKYIKAIKAPIPKANLMVTGGVDVDNIKEWFDVGVSMVGVGSSLTKPGESGDFEGVTNLAKLFKEQVK